jgi:hypothetical protein
MPRPSDSSPPISFLEAGQQKFERFAFGFSDFIKLNKACNKPENE